MHGRTGSHRQYLAKMFDIDGTRSTLLLAGRGTRDDAKEETNAPESERNQLAGAEVSARQWPPLLIAIQYPAVGGVQ